MELFKFLQLQGFGSRKVCRQLIEAGAVEMDGRQVMKAAEQVDPAAVSLLCVNGLTWRPLSLPAYVLLHKPADVEVSHAPTHHRSVFGLLPRPLQQMGLSAVGRLDADTTGLLLFSTNGAFVHALASPRRHVAKRYRVTLKHAAGPELVQRLCDGVLLHDDDTPVKADAARLDAPQCLILTISEGRYHQVKRMVAAAGNRVEALHREAVGPIELGDLPEGAWRELSVSEREALGF